jgi:hypothetical protein
VYAEKSGRGEEMARGGLNVLSNVVNRLLGFGLLRRGKTKNGQQTKRMNDQSHGAEL